MKLALVLVAGLALVWAVTQWRAARHEARAEASHPPTGQILDVDGVQVHASVMGDGPDVVLIHGSSGNLRDMSFALAPALAKNYRVIMIDRPGLGYTHRINDSGATITQQADLLRRAAAQLGAERPIVVGHSYGGAVALAWAVHFPQALSALVPVAAPAMPWDTPLDPLYRVTSSWLGSRLVVPAITAYAPDSRVEAALKDVFAPQPVPYGYAAHFGPGLTLRRVSLRANAKQRANLLGEITALHDRYGEIAVPTEIVHGSADTTVGLTIHAEPLAERIPGATLTRLDGMGHMIQHMATPAIVDAVDRAASRAGLR